MKNTSEILRKILLAVKDNWFIVLPIIVCMTNSIFFGVNEYTFLVNMSITTLSLIIKFPGQIIIGLRWLLIRGVVFSGCFMLVIGLLTLCEPIIPYILATLLGLYY